MGAQPHYLAGESADATDIVPTILAVPLHRESVELLAYWRACETRGGLMLGRDLPAREIARLISKLSVLEPNGGMSDFRFRLTGSGWLRRYGRDVTGEWLSALYEAASLAHYVEGLRRVLETGSPNFVDVRVRNRVAELHHIEYVELPVDSNQGRCVLTGAFHY